MNQALGATALVLIVLASAALAGAEEAPPKRAKPPHWSRDVLDLFFDDAREHLVGERPTPNLPSSGEGAPSVAPARDHGRRTAWSQLVDGETLANEVKRLVAELAEPLANAATFKAGGNNQCRANFGVLAVLFGVIADYDGEVRFRADAAVLRDAASRAARSCTTAADQSFAEAAELRIQLEELIRGERMSGKAAELAKWSDLVERDLIMKRMDRSLQDRISPALGNAKEFAKRAADVRHEAELLATFANVIQREEFDYWDDEGFRAHGGNLQAAATELTRAAIDANYETARAAAGKVTQACSACHEEYRP
jgi:cytochrome c556